PLAARGPVLRGAAAVGDPDCRPRETGVDPWIVLASGAARPKRATLGTAIVGPFTRGPGIIAVGAAAMGEAAPGRFVLGIGSGSNVTVERRNGGRFQRPPPPRTEARQAGAPGVAARAMGRHGRDPLVAVRQ